jgi:hypothetical protein
MTPTLTTSQFLFYAVEPNAGLAIELLHEVDKIKEARVWIPSAPEYIDNVQKAISPGDSDVRTVGIALSVLAGSNSKEIEREQYENFSVVLTVVVELSKRHETAFGLNYGDDEIGYVDRGVPDRSISEGLITPWQVAAGLEI